MAAADFYSRLYTGISPTRVVSRSKTPFIWQEEVKKFKEARDFNSFQYPTAVNAHVYYKYRKRVLHKCDDSCKLHMIYLSNYI